MNVCECCGQEVSNGLRPPDSQGNGTRGWRISSSDSLSHWVYKDPSGRYYEFEWKNPGIQDNGTSEWISDEKAEVLIRGSSQVQWGRGT